MSQSVSHSQISVLSAGKMAYLGGQRIEERKEEYMQGKSLPQLKAMRETFSIELRKQNRMGKTQKRRMLLNAAYAEGEEGEDKPLYFHSIPTELVSICPVIANVQADDETKAGAIRGIIEAAQSTDLVLMALTVLRRSLSSQIAPPVHILLKLDFIPLLLRHLDPEICPVATLAESTWILCNVLSGPRTAVDRAISLGAIPKLINVIRGDMLGVAENAIWALGNIAGEGEYYRDLLLSTDLPTVLYQLVMESPELHCALSKVTAWVCGQLLKPAQPPEHILKALYHILVTLYDMDDTDTKQEVLAAAGNIHSWSYPISLIVSSSGMLNILLAEPGERTDCLVKPSIRALCNLVEADEETTQMALDGGLLNAFLTWFDHPQADIRTDILWGLSNVAAGTPAQVSQFCRHPLCSEAVKSLEDPVCSVRKEASFLYFNLTKQATVSERLALLDYSLFTSIQRLYEDTGLNATNAIKIAERVLAAGEIRANDAKASVNSAAVLYEASGCLQALTRLADRHLPNISAEAEKLLNTYFGEGEEGDAGEAIQTGFSFT